MTDRKISGRALKRTVLELLKSKDLSSGIRKLRALSARQVINPLFSFLYSTDPAIKWNAVTAMGEITARLAEEDTESARVIIRRLMWNLNDESGGIGWGSAEAMGEILARVESLAEEYTPILISYAREDGNFQELEMMQRGVLWGIGRLAQERPELVKGYTRYLMPYMKSPDAVVLGLAAGIMGLIGARNSNADLERLLNDGSEIQIFMDRRLMKCRVKDMAKEALRRLSSL